MISLQLNSLLNKKQSTGYLLFVDKGSVCNIAKEEWTLITTCGRGRAGLMNLSRFDSVAHLYHFTATLQPRTECHQSDLRTLKRMHT